MRGTTNLERDPIRTKIVVTTGPASSAPGALHGLATVGVDVFRLNFSHGTHDSHRRVIHLIREMEKEFKKPFAILGDLSGPKLRLGDVKEGGRKIVTDDIIILTAETADGSGGRFPVRIPGFHRFVKKDERILLDDGKLLLRVEQVKDEEVFCRVIDGGILKSGKGVNLPETDLPFPAMTEKDHHDLQFALKEGVDLVALSFVRQPDDLTKARDAMSAIGREVPLYAKIEKGEAVENLEKIFDRADGVMVARGDLGIEIPLQQVPAVQKRIIRLANKLAKPVITATQMLESMITNSRPTRAEVTDIYNAIIDGTDAVMLSGETAVGEHPAEAVRVIHRVAHEAEKALISNKGIEWVLSGEEKPDETLATCYSAVMIAEQLRLDFILVPTNSGHSAFQVSRFRPAVPIFACSESREIVKALGVAWGVTARLMDALDERELERSETDALVNAAVRAALKHGFARPGDRAVVIGGAPFGEKQHTNYLRILEIEKPG